MSATSYSIAKLKAGLSAIIGEVAGGREIPRVDLAALFDAPPVKLRPGGPDSVRLVRAIRNE